MAKCHICRGVPFENCVYYHQLLEKITQKESLKYMSLFLFVDRHKNAIDNQTRFR